MILFSFFFVKKETWQEYEELKQKAAERRLEMTGTDFFRYACYLFQINEWHNRGGSILACLHQATIDSLVLLDVLQEKKTGVPSHDFSQRAIELGSVIGAERSIRYYIDHETARTIYNDFTAQFGTPEIRERLWRVYQSSTIPA